MAVYDMNEIVPLRRVQLAQVQTAPVETRTCAAFGCKEPVTTAWRVYNLSTIWCRDHHLQAIAGNVPPRTWWQWRRRKKEQ